MSEQEQEDAHFEIEKRKEQVAFEWQEQVLDAEREAIAQLVETATDARDLHDIAARIRARKGQSG